MFLLAESGSTKTDWILFSREGIQRRFRGRGFNPNVQKPEAIHTDLKTELSGQNGLEAVKRLWFYGAGLLNESNRKEMKETLADLFPGAEIEVFHDLLGAARALCGKQSGILCILGTGSNSCFYDGREITGQKGGQGYLFGDEGSGADLGKALLREALNGALSREMIRKLEEWAGMPLLEIRKAAYQNARPNFFLADFSRFISSEIHSPEIRNLVRDRFLAFLEATVLQYPGAKQLPVNFTGTIAFVYREILEESAKSLGIQTGRIIKEPAEDLLRYHFQDLYPGEDLPNG